MELYNLYYSSHIITMIKLRRLRWANGTNGRDEKCLKSLLENLKGRYHLGDISVRGRTALGWILIK
jgi:hypothetical protein